MSNTGFDNTGEYNTGDSNTGDYNTGHRNTGDCNIGDDNTGNHNTGHRNTGSHNTGHWNTGSHNTGNWNTGNWNTGNCNTDTPTVRLFNKDSGLKFFGETHNKFRSLLFRYTKHLCEWVYEKDMTEQEKKDNTTYETTGGYLKINDSIYNGKEVTKEDREFLESLPNFCPKILKECTGIVFSNPKKTIILDGKRD
jgi:hypothetical protein